MIDSAPPTGARNESGQCNALNTGWRHTTLAHMQQGSSCVCTHVACAHVEQIWLLGRSARALRARETKYPSGTTLSLVAQNAADMQRPDTTVRARGEDSEESIRVAWHSTEKDSHTSKRSIPKAAECPPSSAATRRRPSSQELKTRSDDDVESCKLCARSLKEPATQRGLSSAASSITARQHDGQRGAPSRCGVHATNSRPVRRSQPCQSK